MAAQLEAPCQALRELERRPPDAVGDAGERDGELPAAFRRRRPVERGAEIVELRKKIEDIEEEARKTSVPPGWLR